MTAKQADEPPFNDIDALRHDDPILAIWQPYSAAPLTSEDRREIVANVTGVFTLLSKWAQQDALRDRQAGAQ